MNDIINILNQVRIVSQKIKEQRKEKFERGENYNIFNDLGFMSDEVHLHSMFLANLLNPKGSHGQRGKFLEAFLKMLHYCPVKILDLEINRVDHHPLGR